MVNLTVFSNSAKELVLTTIRSNLVNRYQELGISASIPGFEKYANNFLVFTGQKPVTTTQPATNLTTTSATLNGIVNANSLSTTVTFEYGTAISYGSIITATQNPVTGSSSVNVSAAITGLLPRTTYHFRVKTVNTLGTVNGNDLTFTTLGGVPIATTLAAANITASSATLKGNADGNYLSLTTVSFDWGTTTNYGLTIPANSASGYFYADVMVLLAGTTYHYRIKAVNSLGTTVGNDMTFTTFFTGITGTVIDVEGNSYKTIGIGSQIWMAENLETTKFNNGTSIPIVTDGAAWAALVTPGYCWYNNDAAANKATYGAMYNWYVVDPTSNGGKNVCPTNWHVPSIEQWSTLTNFLINNGYGYGGSGTDIGKSMAATSGWNTNGTAGYIGNDQASNNSSGFTALPGGARYDDGTFNYLRQFGRWWSSTENSIYNALGPYMDTNSNTVYVTWGSTKQSGLSVRCIKDN